MILFSADCAAPNVEAQTPLVINMHFSYFHIDEGVWGCNHFERRQHCWKRESRQLDVAKKAPRAAHVDR